MNPSPSDVEKARQVYFLFKRSFEEVNGEPSNYLFSLDEDKKLIDLIATALAEQREKDARIAETVPQPLGRDSGCKFIAEWVGREVASAIREQGERV